jgi:predicted dehydrogenase
MNENQTTSPDYNRRDFLKSGSVATLMGLLGGVELFAQNEPAPAGEAAAGGARLKIGVIGLGLWGREIVNTLALLPQAEVAVLCDTYPAAARKAAQAAPGATQTQDYKTILENKDISAVVVATPTHQHKEIVLAALKAGKHVYCEAPLAHTVEDAREMAQAAKAVKQIAFQSGLQLRADKQRLFIRPFIRSGALGQAVMARAQFHKKQSWRFPAPTPEREKELNWRLDKGISLGLTGELGIHAIDQAGWFFNARPTAISGFGNITLWNDGREVPDTVQMRLEFPGGVFMSYNATLANSFDADYEMLYGSFAAVMMRENRAWMFKEVDSPLLGWEVYAAKQTFGQETGIALVADASKAPAVGNKPATPPPFSTTPLHYALAAFVHKCAAIDDFISTMGADDLAALAEHLERSHLVPAAGYLEGYQATVTVIKANEALLTGKRVELKPEWYELG